MLLVRYWGLIGIALGTSLASFLSSAWMVPRAVISHVGLTRREFLTPDNFIFIVRTTGLVLAIFFARSMLSDYSHFMQLLGIATITGIAGVVLFGKLLQRLLLGAGASR